LAFVSGFTTFATAVALRSSGASQDPLFNFSETPSRTLRIGEHCAKARASRRPVGSIHVGTDERTRVARLRLAVCHDRSRPPVGKVNGLTNLPRTYQDCNAFGRYRTGVQLIRVNLLQRNTADQSGA
jgi:hypothetical protein